MSTRNFMSGDPYGISWTINNASGALVDADSTPVGTLYRNGAPDGAVAVTVSNPATGVYSATATIPAAYAAGDRVSLLVTASVNGTGTGTFVDHVRLVGWPNTVGAAGSLLTVGTGAGQVNPNGAGKVPATLAASDVNGALPSNITQVSGANTPTPNVAGVLVVDASYEAGAAIVAGVAQAGGPSTITLAASAPGIADFYKYRLIGISGGTGVDQIRFVTAYDGATRVATVNRPWDVAPDATSQYELGGTVENAVSVQRNAALTLPFYMVLSTDGVSPAVGKAIAATRSLDGGAFSPCAGTVGELGNGWYAIALAASDLNGAAVGLSFAAAGCNTSTATLVTQP